MRRFLDTCSCTSSNLHRTMSHGQKRHHTLHSITYQIRTIEMEKSLAYCNTFPEAPQAAQGGPSLRIHGSKGAGTKRGASRQGFRAGYPRAGKLRDFGAIHGRRLLLTRRARGVQKLGVEAAPEPSFDESPTSQQKPETYHKGGRLACIETAPTPKPQSLSIPVFCHTVQAFHWATV